MAKIRSPRNNIIRPRGYTKPAKFFLDTQHPLSRGLVGFWPLDDIFGTANTVARDTSQFGNAGVQTSISAIQSGPRGGTVPVFSTSSVDIPFLGIYQLPSVFTLVSWIYPTSLGLNFVFGQINATDTGDAHSGYKMYINSGKILFFNGFANATVMNGTTAVSANVWSQIGVTSDGTLAKTWINGAQDNSVSYSTGFGNDSDGLRIGANQNSAAQAFAGAICLCRIYNRALSATEFAALYAEPYAGVYASPADISGAAAVDATVALDGVSATAAAGTLTTSATGSTALVGAAGTAAAGSLSLVVTSTKALTGVSGTAAAGTLTASASASVNLVGASATASAGDLYPAQSILSVPMITIMNDDPIAVSETMNDDDIPMEADMPYQLPFEAILNTNPIPMTGTLSAVPVPGEGSVP